MADTIYERAWGHYISLIDFLVNTGTTRPGEFQPYNLATALPYTKQHPNFDLFLIQNACNYVAPRVPVETDSEGSRNKQLSHNNKLDEAYAGFLVELDDILLKEVDPSERPEYVKLNGELETAQGKYNDYVTFVHDRWADELARRNIPEDQREAERIIFERDRSYSSELERRKRGIQAASARLNAYLRKVTPKEYWRLVDAKAWFEDPNYQIKLPSVAAFDDERKKQYWSQFHQQVIAFDLDDFLTRDSERDRTFDTQSEDYSRVEEKWQVKASARWGLFSGGGSAERRRMEEISQKKHFVFKVTAKRIEEFDIFRAKWFQDVLFETVGKKFRQYWGPSGLLGAIPYSVVVARGLTLEGKLEEEYRRTLEEYFKSGGSFGFGPFFSASGGYEKDAKYMNFTKTADGFSLKDSDTTIRLLGARVRRFNWDENEARSYHSIPDIAEFVRIASKNP